MNDIPEPRSPAAVIVWVAEGTWRACVDAARGLAPGDARIILLHVSPEEIPAAAHGAYAGLLGRGHPERDPGTRLADMAASDATALLDAAARRLARPCERTERRGRVEREVIAASDGARLLILARDGDPSDLGPRSLGRAGRFIVDHSPCPVLLVWPERAPDVHTIPPHPPHGHHPPHRPGPPHPGNPPGPGGSGPLPG